MNDKDIDRMEDEFYNSDDGQKYLELLFTSPSFVPQLAINNLYERLNNNELYLKLKQAGKIL